MANVMDVAKGCCYSGGGIFGLAAIKNFSMDMYNRVTELGIYNPFGSPYFDDMIVVGLAVGAARIAIPASAHLARYCGSCITGRGHDARRTGQLENRISELEQRYSGLGH